MNLPIAIPVLNEEERLRWMGQRSSTCFGFAATPVDGRVRYPRELG